MKTALHDYFLFPKVVPAGQPATLHVIPRGGHARLTGEVRVRICPSEQHDRLRRGPEEVTVSAGADGSLSFSWIFAEEQEHFLRFFRPGGSGWENEPFLQLSVYSLQEDLYGLVPLRGDLHVHTCRSDGREDEAFVLANYRRAGYDFMAVTDHLRYAPSLEAMRQAKRLRTGLAVYPGEEVHPLGLHPEYGDWNIIDQHIVHVGGSRSVNDEIRADAAAFEAALAPLLPLAPRGVNARTYAAAVLAARRIRSCGGLAILAHPMWLEEDGAFNVEPALARALLLSGEFDAFELTGGMTVRENNLQQAFFASLREEGLRLPIVGSSDSHGTTNAVYFEESSTIAFARDASWPSVREAILAHRAVAVEHYHGEKPRAQGAYRLVKYACFLLNEYFPQHDALCRMEGDWMHADLDGEPDCPQVISRCAARVHAFRERSFGRTAAQET